MKYMIRTLGKDEEVTEDQFRAAWGAADGDTTIKKADGDYCLLCPQEGVVYTPDGNEP